MNLKNNLYRMEQPKIININRKDLLIHSHNEKWTKAVKSIKCKFCGYTWIPNITNPKACPYCKRYLKRA